MGNLRCLIWWQAIFMMQKFAQARMPVPPEQALLGGTGILACALVAGTAKNASATKILAML
jgi:hypothetical protein